MPVSPLLQRFVEDELARAPTLAERCMAGTLQLLRDHGGLSSSERDQHFELVEGLQRQASRYQARFVESLGDNVRRELNRQDGGDVAAAALAGGLELMDESRVEVDIEISRAMQIIDSTAEWELRELQTFTSTLIGQQHVSAESNPLRPLVFATALWEAAGAVTAAQVQRMTLLRISAGVMAGLLKNAWAAASTRLEAQGVEPGIYRTVVLAPDAVPSRTAAAAGAVPPTADPTRPGALTTLLAGAGARSPGSPAAGPVAGAPGGRDPRGGDTQLVQLMARLFALIQADSHLAAPLRPLVARLQVSALRIAQQEPAMLDNRDHPVWQLINRIALAAAAYPLQGDKRFTALLTFVDALTEEIARAPTGEATLYRRAVLRLETFLGEQQQWQLREAQAAQATLQRAERREVLEQVLGQRLTEQMAPVRTTAPIRRFVTGAWAKVIAESMLKFGEQVEPTPTYLKTVDDLLWSLQTPDHPQSRQRLLGLLPTLLQRLREGMALIQWPAAEQQAVLDELMTIHTAALRPGARGGASLSAEEIVQRMRDEVLPEAPPVRPFSDSVIDLASMDTVPADFLPTGALGSGNSNDTARRLDTLAPGQRQRIFLQGRWARTQLLWRSDQGQYFLFAGEQAGRTHSITRRALERLDAAGLLQPLQTRPLVERSVDALLNQLALPS